MSRNQNKDKKIELNFGFQNFKSFKNFQFLKVKPLTVICGINNSGKSSIIQSLLLLKQSLARFEFYYSYPLLIEKKVKYKNPLSFEGDFCHLSDFNNTINIYTRYKNIKFKFEFNNDIYIFEFSKPKKDLMAEVFIKQIDIEGSDYELTFKSNLNEEGQVIDYNFYIKKIKLLDLIKSSYDLDFILKGKKTLEKKYKNFIVIDKSIRNVNLRLFRFIPIEVQIPINEFHSQFESYLIENQQNLNELLVSYNEWKNFRKKNERKWEFLRFHLMGSIDLLNYLLNIHYIGPLRDDPHRYYQFFDIKRFEIGNKGENTSQILILEKNLKIPPFNIFEIEDNHLIFIKQDNISLKEGLKIWSEKLNLPNIDPQKVEQTLFKVMVELPKDKKKVTLQDVGFGISQILPVYVESLRMPINHTLILEQPEIHLHPSMQSKLADFLLSMANSGKNFIIETHSEHLINRLCLRIAQDQTNKLKDLVSIVFVEPPKLIKGNYYGSTIKLIEINKYGEVLNWPSGFLDESDHGKILKAGIDKMNQEKLENS